MAKNKDNNKTVGFKAATQVNGIDAGTDDTSVQSIISLSDVTGSMIRTPSTSGSIG